MALLTFVAVCRGTPVQKSAPGIEILPAGKPLVSFGGLRSLGYNFQNFIIAAFSNGNGPSYVVVGDNESMYLLLMRKDY